jgi:hypothetical protein
MQPSTICIAAGYLGEKQRSTKLAPIEESGKLTGDELTYRRLEVSPTCC